MLISINKVNPKNPQNTKSRIRLLESTARMDTNAVKII
jgi:hypothetical protein